MEKRAKYAKLHPEMSNLDLTKILSKKYKELPEKKKVSNTLYDYWKLLQIICKFLCWGVTMVVLHFQQKSSVVVVPFCFGFCAVKVRPSKEKVENILPFPEFSL